MRVKYQKFVCRDHIYIADKQKVLARKAGQRAAVLNYNVINSNCGPSTLLAISKNNR